MGASYPERIKILILEHDPLDLELLHRALSKDDLDYVFQTVQTEIDFVKALLDFQPDIVLADYALPSFNGHAALILKQKFAPLVPLIVVSGAIGEELAVTLMRDGATDYVLKDRMNSLPVKITRALNEAAGRFHENQISQEIIRKEKHLNRAQRLAGMGSWELDIETGFAVWSDAACEIYGLPSSQNRQTHKKWLGLIHPEEIGKVEATLEQAEKNSERAELEFRIVRPEGTIRHIHSITEYDFDPDGNPKTLLCISFDVTDKKTMQV
jgi:PAS domain S-box-containing protein